MTCAFPTRDEPNLTRPYLMALIADTISSISHNVPSSSVCGTTRVLPTHIAKFVLDLKKLGLIKLDDQLPIVATVDDLLEQVKVLEATKA